MTEDRLAETDGFLTADEMDAIEDMFFCVITKKRHIELRPLILSAWKKLCNIHDPEDNDD